MEAFETQPGFCPVCGTIFPPMKEIGNICCYNCKKNFEPDVLVGEMEEYTIYFNTYDPDQVPEKNKTKDEVPDGPIVERVCSKCGYEKMSYATVQLRSADEGQTVFFTCLKCKFKDSENS